MTTPASLPHTAELRLLGPPQLFVDGREVALERRKALALLAYLAVEAREHPRDMLATLLAPDDPPSAARAGLRRALAELRGVVRPWLATSGDRIALRRDAAFSLDVDQLLAADAARSAAQPGADLRAVAALYRGDFMAGFSLAGSANFEEWQFFQAERLRAVYADLLDRLTAQADTPEGAAQGIEDARRWLTLDPLHEPAHRRLMQHYAAAGQPAAALRQYRLLGELLERELGVAPDAASTALYEQIRGGERGAQSSRWSSAPPRLPLATVAGASIEIPALPFLGREAELARVAAALADPACRILTLIGPGGMGKTRLAVQAAAQHRDRFPQGIYQVSLIGVATAERLLTTLATALGIGGPHELLDRIGAALHDRSALILLDNFDQVLDAAPLLHELVRRAPRLKLLVTARERLQLQEEWVVDIAGLAVPPSAEAPDAIAYSAIQLFAQRARQVRADFVLSDENLADVVAICRLVEGMPLAIELAAAWLRALTPAEILRELTESMAILTTTLRDVPERHRSVEGVFAQTWERLSEPERRALSRLAVFDDGFTRAAAMEVAQATPIILAGLMDRALIRRDRAGRYAIHELLRQYAAQRLAADPGAQQATLLHFCRMCMRLLEQRNGDLQGAHQRQALAELEAEYDNLWVAWNWGVQERRLEELAAGLDGWYRLHELRGWYLDGIQSLAQLAARLEGATDAEAALLLARTRTRIGALACWVGQFAEAERALEAALPLLRANGLLLDVAFTLTSMGYVASEQDDIQRAEELLREGLEAYRALGHQSGVAWAIDALGDLAGGQGDYARARELLNESSTIFSALGDQVSAAWSLSGLGRVLDLMGDRAAARQLLEESLVLFEALEDQHGAAMAHANLGEIAAAARDPQAAREHWRSALRMARDVGVVPLVIDAIVGLAALMAEEEPERAHELVQRALAHSASWKETLAAARSISAATAERIGAPAAELAARRGRATPWEVAAATLLEE
jgi:predicted ATPase/DNA-binding SARP family transcriptional activator/Tfp pilus assembly protein PilF